MIVFPDTVQLEPLLIWNGFCLGMNLLAFVEFIVVHNMYMANELKKKQTQELDVEAPPSSTGTKMSVSIIFKISANINIIIPNVVSSNPVHGDVCVLDSKFCDKFCQ
jgi:hypothetical protein